MHQNSIFQLAAIIRLVFFSGLNVVILDQYGNTDITRKDDMNQGVFYGCIWDLTMILIFPDG